MNTRISGKKVLKSQTLVLGPSDFEVVDDFEGGSIVFRFAEKPGVEVSVTGSVEGEDRVILNIDDAQSTLGFTYFANISNDGKDKYYIVIYVHPVGGDRRTRQFSYTITGLE